MASIEFDPLLNNHIFTKENGEIIFIPFGSKIVIKDDMFDGTVNIMMLYYPKSDKIIQLRSNGKYLFKDSYEEIYITKNERKILNNFLKDKETKALINLLRNIEN